MASVIIRHPKTGHEVGVELADFHHRKLTKDKDGEPVSYEEAGYKVVSYMDGSEYKAPKAEHKAETKAEG